MRVIWLRRNAFFLRIGKTEVIAAIWGRMIQGQDEVPKDDKSTLKT